MSVPRAVLVLLALLALFVGVDNMQRPLAHPDEGRYSEISREMAASGDWVTPRLNGIKYFEKPPLQYWASAAAFRLFGESPFTARIYTALAGLLALAAVASRPGASRAPTRRCSPSGCCSPARTSSAWAAW